MATNNTQFYPLTYSQKRILNIELEHSHTSLCNIGGHVTFEGSIQLAILEQAIQMFIEDNEAVRIQITEIESNFFQKVKEYQRSPFEIIDFSERGNKQDNFSDWIQHEAEKPFVFTNSWLFYFALFKLSENKYGYLAKFHHIIADGWSMQLMTDQIIDNYQLLIGQNINNKNQKLTTYINYIEQEQNYLNSQRFIKDKSYWNKKFESLPTDSVNTLINKQTNSTKGKRLVFNIEKETSLQIKNFIKNTPYSLQTFFVSLYSILIHKISRKSDVYLRIPVSNRTNGIQKNTFGMYASTIPFWINISSDDSILEVLKTVHLELRRDYIHQKYPFNLIIRELQSNSKISDQIFDLSINCYNTYLRQVMDGVKVYNEEFYNGHQNYSMQLIVREWSNSGSIELDFDFNVGNFSEEEIVYLYEKLLFLVNQVLKTPTKKVVELSILSDNEIRELLVDFNSTESFYPKNKSMHQLFEEQVLLNPYKIAINFNNLTITYEELNEKVNQLANYLISRGIGQGSIVGILAEHNQYSVIGILAILKSGGAYLPIDPTYPISRIKFILEDSGTKLVLSDNVEVEQQVEVYDVEFMKLNDGKFFSGKNRNPESKSKPNDLAYVIYTSGSTGRPKGTLIEHQSLVNYIWWAKKMYVSDINEIFALFTSFAFDLTVTSIFTPLISGGSIAIYNNDGKDHVLRRILNENRVTVLKLTPAQLSLMQKFDELTNNTSIKRMIVGGEELKSNSVRLLYEKWKRPIEILNEYGPTEATVGCMIAKYNHKNNHLKSVPIGRPADNVQIYLLDSYKKPVPKQVEGEIYISGEGLARGYLNNPKLNEEKFIDNPFIPGKKMYKTGDRARMLYNGDLVYLGRNEDFIKHKGYRIELGEIDSILLSCEGVLESVTLQRMDNSANAYLCSFVVCAFHRTERELMEELSKQIPYYMIPESIKFLDRMPLNKSNKIDKQRLLTLETHISEINKTSYEERVAVLVSVVSKILQVKNVYKESNFYHLGGDSIKAIQIASALNEKGYQILVKDIMTNPVIKDIAIYMYSQQNIERTIESTQGNVPLTPIVSWFFEQKFEFPEMYHQSILLQVNEDIGESDLKLMWSEIINIHDSLRMVVNYDTGQLMYQKELNHHKLFLKKDFSCLPSETQEENIQKTIQEIKRSTDLEKGPLARACLFELGSMGKKLLLTAHHLVIDGISWRIILKDMQTIISQLRENKNLTFSNKSSSYKDWALKINHYNCAEEESYWKQQSEKIYMTLPYKYTDSFGNQNICVVQNLLELDETNDLLYSANQAYRTETNDLLLCALFLTLFDFCNTKKAVVELEGHGREELFQGINLNRTVGWFTSLYPFAWEQTNEDLSLQIKSIKERLREVPNHGVGFGILKYIQKKNNMNHPLIRFNYLGEFINEGNEEFWKVLDISGITKNTKNIGNHLSTEIDIQCIVLKNRLSISVNYSLSSFTEDTMQSFLQAYMNHLRKIIHHCCNRESLDFTLSDFDGVQLSEEDFNKIFE